MLVEVGLEMELIINGESRKVSATYVQQLVEELGLAEKMIVVEVDGQIVDKEDWAGFQLAEGMKIEVVHFVGGG